MLIQGHPYRLYYYMKDGYPEFFLAYDEKNAKKRDHTALSVSVTILIKLYGHRETNAILKQFGKTWICCEGGVYYRNNGFSQ